MAATPRKPPPKTLKAMIFDRSTGDILVLMIATTVCFTIMFTVIAIVVVKLWHPEIDTDIGVRSVVSLLNTMIGLLAGFLAGRSDTAMTVQKTEARLREEELNRRESGQ